MALECHNLYLIKIIKLIKTKGLEKKLSTADNADTGYVLEVDLKYTDKARKVS